MRVRKKAEDRIELEVPELSHDEIRQAVMDDPSNLGLFCGELAEGDWDVCLAAVERNGFALRDVPEAIQEAHPELCEAAIRKSGHIGLGEDGRGFPSDMAIAHVKNPAPELLRMAVSMNGMALEYVPLEVQDEALCMEAVARNPLAIRFVRISGEAYECVAMAAIVKDPTALEFAPRQTPRLCMAAIEADGACLRFVKEPTEEMRMAAVRQNGMALEHVSEQTEELCMAAIGQNPFALLHVDIGDDEAYERVCLAAVELDPAVIELATPQALRACLAAVRADGTLLRRIGNPTHDICLAAVRNNGMALRFVEDQTATVCIAALLQDPSAIECVGDCVRADAMRGCGRETAARGHLRFREKDVPHVLPLLWKCAERREEEFAMDVLKDMVAKDPRFLRHVENQTKEICMMAVQFDGMALEHVKPGCLSPNDYAEICMEAVRRDCGAFRHAATRSNDAIP